MVGRAIDDYTQLPDGRWVLKDNAVSSVPNSKKDQIWRTTDTGNAGMIGEIYGDNLRYDHRRRRWLIWNEHHWQPDRDGEVTRMAQYTAKLRYMRAADIPDTEQRRQQANWAISSESRMRLGAAVSLAQDTRPMADSGENWDQDIHLLGVSNGVVDLRTGELRRGRPEDRITMTTGVDFDPSAECPRFQRFMEEVFDDHDLVDWLWRALGYSITGDTSEQCIFMGYGKGQNGKGKLRDAMHAAIGDYAYTAPFSTFELYQRASIPNDLAALEFKRFVDSSETNDNTRLNEARIKALSGCDPMTARYLHQEFFTFEPHLKMWLFVNHKPRVVDDSFGFWRRVRLIPFMKQFLGEDEDKHLGAKLRAEAEGILAWLVRGCLEWQRRGLDPVPECVKIATEEYQQESDELSGFLTVMCVERLDATVKASRLYEAYKTWAEDEGMDGKEIMTMTKFGRRISGRFTKRPTKDGIFYTGINVVWDEPGEGLVKGFEANITGSDVSPIHQPLRVKTQKTIHNPSPLVETLHRGCPNCGSVEWWQNPGGQWTCGRCHPKPVSTTGAA